MSHDDRFHRADRLFDAALDLMPAERSSFLDRECGDDVPLRALVERLLRRADATISGELATGRAIEASPELFGSEAERAFDLSGSLLDRYRVEREIGRGGMGVVYEALDEKLRRTVAIKVLPFRSIADRVRERFQREAQAAAALNHPNIVAIHDAGEASGRPFLVMEFSAGDSLDQRPPESIDEALAIARRVCDALEHAHARGLVHRDLKPGNIIVNREGDHLDVKLTDMGIALARGAARVTLTGAITGTPAFMAPEQALGSEVDGRADLYSLGVMLYSWVAGRLPFDGDDALAVVSQHIHAPVVPPRTFRPDIPAGLEPIILRLMSKSADARYASAAELRGALEGVGSEIVEGPAPGRVAIEGLTRGRMVGRREELERLQGLWSAALDGRSHLALVSGEPGVGKTRLARELTATAQLDGALALTGGCYENEATTPYLPFLEAFRRIVRERDDEELAEALGDTAAEIARLAPEIESRLGPLPARPSLSPQEERLRLFDHVARFLRRLAHQRGLLLFLDDLQWADHGSLSLLHYLLRQLADERILFLGAYREVELDRTHALSKTLVDWNRERLATRVRLDRLDLEATARMIRTLLGQHDVSDAFVASLHEETDGNPFFVEEIVKALIAEGDLVHEGTRWRRHGSGEFVLPQSVKAAIGSRLERISDSCSEVLRTAAVLGKMFDFAELASVAGRSEDELIDALDEAVAAQLIVAGRGESFAFTHDKIREVLYDELNPIRRRRLHGRIAEGLERLQEKGDAVAVEDLAHHFVESGNFDKGLCYADRAAAAAMRVFAYDEAIEMLSRARECADALERAEDLVRIDEATGDAVHARGDVYGSVQLYERALAGMTDPLRRNALRSKIGEAYVIPGDPRGLDHVRRALEELDATKWPGETAHAMMIEARYLHVAGELQRAAERYRPAIEIAERVGDPSLLVRIYSFFAGTLQHLAELDESDGVSRRCIEIGERESLPTGVMLGHEFLSENNFYRGRWRDCVRHGEREEALAIESQAGERYGWSHFRSLAEHQLGHLEQAESLYRRCIDECQRTGDRRLEIFMRSGLAALLADRGLVDRATRKAERAVAEADEASLLAHRIVCREFLVYVYLAQERYPDAEREARIAVELWRTSGSQGALLITGARLAEGLVRGGAADETHEVLATHAELADRTGSDHRTAQNLRVGGLLAASEGRLEEARSALEGAVARFDACESRIELDRARQELARLDAPASDS